MSATPRLFVSQTLAIDQVFEIEVDQAKYLTRVLRLGVDDAVRVFNGRDGEWRAVIDNVDGRSVHLRPVECLRPQPDQSNRTVTLIFAPVKKTQTDFIIEKATELGVKVVQPVTTEFTQTRTVRLDRFNKIALEAAEQTERLDLPEIRQLATLDDAINNLEPGARLIFCDESGDDESADWGGEPGRARPMAEALDGVAVGTVAVLIGPEGGFSPSERATLRGLTDCLPVSLGPRILRAETAVVSALTLWQALKGDWR